MTLEIGRPWARAATSKQGVGGGFFAVTNTGSEPDRLVAASTPAADTVEIHAIKVVGPDIKMRLLERGIAVAPGATVTLKPRGYHLLMTGLKSPLAVGAKVPVALVFERAGTVQAELVVEAPGAVGEETLVAGAQPG